MPAGSDPTPEPAAERPDGRETPPFPHTYRPVGARVAAATAAVAIVAAISFLWLMLPGEVQDQFSVFQRITLVGFFVVILVLLNGIFRTCARATGRGLVVVNGYRSHELVWGQIVRLSLTPHRPWALIDLDDGTTLSVMAIQTSDGARATRSARELGGVIARENRTEHDS